MRWFSGLVFTLFALLVAPMLAAQAVAPAFLPAGELRVGVNPEQPPLIFEQGGRLVGLEADLARGLSRDLGAPLNFVVMDWDQLIPALLAGKIDIIMSGMSATDVRAVRVNFATPYLVTGQMPLVRAGEVSRYPTTLALKNTDVKVGVEEGTTGDFYVRENFPYAERVPFPDINLAASALAADEVGMVVADAPTVWWLASERESQGLTPITTLLTQEGIAWAVAKTNPDLLAAATAYLYSLQRQGGLDPLIERWLPFATTGR